MHCIAKSLALLRAARGGELAKRLHSHSGCRMRLSAALHGGRESLQQERVRHGLRWAAAGGEESGLRSDDEEGQQRDASFGSNFGKSR